MLNFTKMTKSIEELNNYIIELKQKKENYKKKIREITNDLKNLGIDDLDTYENLLTLYNDNKEKYNIFNLYDLLSYLLNINEEIGDFLTNNGFDGINDLIDFINNSKQHKCVDKSVKYLSHNELMENNYYSQLINSCYIINKQLKEEKKKYNDLYKEVSYFRNLYINDTEKREYNKLLDENIIINRPIKVTLNKPYFDRYFKLLLNKKEKEEKAKPKINKGFVLYRFRNIVNRIIYKNRKQRFVNKIKTFINNMNVYLKSRRPKKVTIGHAMYDKYKKERILNNFNKVKLVKNKIILIKKIKKYLIKYRKQKKKCISVLEKNKNIINDIINNNIKYKKSSVYNRLYQSNRDTIDLYSGYYEDYVLNNKKDEIKLIQECYDKNSGRFLRILELFNIIKKDDQLYNSDYIFNYYKLSDVNKKDDGFNLFINKLKDELFINSTKEPIIGDGFFDDEINNNIYIDKKDEIDSTLYQYECIKCKNEFKSNFKLALRMFRVCDNCDL